MTDAGGFLPDRDTSASDERARLLRQIADALNLPVTAFARGLAPVAVAGPSSAECAAVLSAFSRIRDPRLRSQCLQMLERCAEP
ncbi:hypothetical protein Q8W71_14510 [Methylobacterium sp. NEAU 140]|uniref:hypothetical protein n=1 Tax=Methylobacterium sp. NEAU 140 TaxID=3064945 RepID=UPI002734C89C|nr:hypothetical protein [Methylobacterium sp. NEAU 140]MDP4023844.1 hypothetical protein [Methylobacterium sp. NEAU 140]